MYTVRISDRITELTIKTKKELTELIENVAPPLGLKYPSIEWIHDKLKSCPQVKLQNLPNYLVIRRIRKAK